MRILSIGKMLGISNTCRLRNMALEEIADKVDVVNTEKESVSLWYKISYHLFLIGLPVYLPDCSSANKKIKKLISINQYDIIWIDKGVTINPKTLKRIKELQPNAKLISYSPDNMALRHNQSQNYLKCIPLYDYHITTKSYILDDMRNLGAKNISFVCQSYESKFHYPRKIDDKDLKSLGADVGFVGSWEKERMDSILYLTRNGIKVRVFGDKKWEICKNDNPNLIIENYGLYDEDYSKSFKCFKICLCFLRKMNFDQHTSRTMEIPASGGFMLAERTDEHMMLFKEGREAEFFNSNEELLKKCRYYLEDEEARNKIAEGGLKRCKESGYSNVDTIRKILNNVIDL
ncbi:glycosyltransferase family 1 protein [Clostridium perfringens]|uniref:CgeB family protein n=1 Tax=Clostridium perfringens TaxID=1502 RepID=UPI00290338FB|nr:glycosyltransferase [Clostridium perfringens]